MTTVTDTIQCDRNCFKDVLSTGKLGWTTARTGRERVASGIHSKRLIRF